MPKDTRLVYSTDQGRIKEPKPSQTFSEGDGIVRIRRETKGRKGSGVTTVTGIPGDATTLKTIAKQLKQLCGSGGSIKDGVIEIQGDHREAIKIRLASEGFTVRLAGG